MADQDMVTGERQDKLLIENPHLVHGLSHCLGTVQSRTSESLPQTGRLDMDLRLAGSGEIGLGQDLSQIYLLALTIDKEMGLTPEEGLQKGYDQINENKHKYNLNCQNGLLQHEIHVNQNDRIMDIQDSQLRPSAQDHGLNMSENHEAVIENCDLDGNLEVVGGDQNHETDFISSTHHSLQQPEFVIASPIVQSRLAAPPLTHELVVGQEFPDVKSCRRALRDMAIALHFEIQTVKSDKTRFTAKCASEGCPWRIHAAKVPGVPAFTIRTIHAEHTCGGIAHLGHQQASVQWVASSVGQQLRENPHYKPKEILEEIHRVHGITLSYKQAWRGKERFMASLQGSFEEDYRLLPQYCDLVRQTNPGSIASVYVNPLDNCFQRLFISYQASIYGFLNACRPIIGLDRIALKNRYLGSLLVATGFDGDGALFPLAFGFVDKENDDNWMWFLSELRNLLENNTGNMPRLNILSDREKSVVDAVESYFPTAFHGFCMHHLSESFQKEFNNTVLVNLLWEAAKALAITEFDMKILEMEKILPDAAYWVRRIPPHLWANSHFEGKHFGHLTGNISESSDAWVQASGLPIIQMMESIRRQLMIWFNERREISIQWTSTLVPSAERSVSEALELARTYQVLRANEAEFEVISCEGTYTVDIRNRCCLCRGWQVYGLPCSHAVSALLSCRQNVHRFTESCFTVATYREAYSQTIHPIPDRTFWPEIIGGSESEGGENVIVNPPKSLQPPGQPRKKRTRSDRNYFTKRIVRCSRCNQTGHFRTTCVAPI